MWYGAAYSAFAAGYPYPRPRTDSGTLLGLPCRNVRSWDTCSIHLQSWRFLPHDDRLAVPGPCSALQEYYLTVDEGVPLGISRASCAERACQGGPRQPSHGPAAPPGAGVLHLASGLRDGGAQVSPAEPICPLSNGVRRSTVGSR
jgi:hypothetical protein